MRVYANGFSTGRFSGIYGWSLAFRHFIDENEIDESIVLLIALEIEKFPFCYSRKETGISFFEYAAATSPFIISIQVSLLFGR